MDPYPIETSKSIVIVFPEKDDSLPPVWANQGDGGLRRQWHNGEQAQVMTKALLNGM